jgi:hypothetical protein
MNEIMTMIWTVALYVYVGSVVFNVLTILAMAVTRPRAVFTLEGLSKTIPVLLSSLKGPVSAMSHVAACIESHSRVYPLVKSLAEQQIILSRLIQQCSTQLDRLEAGLLGKRGGNPRDVEDVLKDFIEYLEKLDNVEVVHVGMETCKCPDKTEPPADDKGELGSIECPTWCIRCNRKKEIKKDGMCHMCLIETDPEYKEECMPTFNGVPIKFKDDPQGQCSECKEKKEEGGLPNGQGDRDYVSTCAKKKEEELPPSKGKCSVCGKTTYKDELYTGDVDDGPICDKCLTRRETEEDKEEGVVVSSE